MIDDPKRARLELMNKSEGRRVLAMGAVLLGVLVYLFTTPHVAPPTSRAQGGPSIPIAPPPTLDARATLATWRARQAEEERGEVPTPRVADYAPDRAVLAQVEDFALDVVEEPGFYELLAAVHGMADDEVLAAPAKHGSFTWEQLHTAEGRDAARGKFITIKGRMFTRLDQRVLERYPNEAGLAWVWQGTFRHENRGFYVTITDKQFEPHTGIDGEPLELTGAFLKVYRFKPVNDEEDPSPKALPHLIVKSMRRLPAQEPDRGTNFAGWALIALFSVTSLAMFLYSRLSRREDARFEAWRASRHGTKARTRAKSLLAAAEAEVTAAEAGGPGAGGPGEVAPPLAAAPPSSPSGAPAAAGDADPAAPATPASQTGPAVLAAPPEAAGGALAGAAALAAPEAQAVAQTDGASPAGADGATGVAQGPAGEPAEPAELAPAGESAPAGEPASATPGDDPGPADGPDGGDRPA